LGFEVYLCGEKIADDRDPALSRAVRVDDWALPAPGPRQRMLISMHRLPEHRFACVHVVEPGSMWSQFVCIELPKLGATPPQLKFKPLKRYPLPTEFDRPFTFDDGM